MLGGGGADVWGVGADVGDQPLRNDPHTMSIDL